MEAILQSWIDYVFIDQTDKPEWAGPREQIPVLISETFERSGELLAKFSDEQLDQGFWHLLSEGPPQFMGTLANETIPLEPRLRAVRSIATLFEQVMAVRSTSHLSHLDDKGASPLNSACYMWWDLLRLVLCSTSLVTQVIATLHRQLVIPHDACRESALHGIGHLRRDSPQYQKQLSGIIDEFLDGTPGLRTELIAYAEQARRGELL